MALTKCKECGNSISTKAETCPQCGAKPKKKTSFFTWFVVIGIGAAVIGSMNNDLDRPGVASAKSSAGTGAASSVVTKESPTEKPKVPQWTTTTSADPMTGKKSAYAHSPTISSSERMEFPYSDVTAWMGVGCDSSGKWAYIGFNQEPNLTNTKIGDGFNVVNTRIKFDEIVEEISFRQSWGDKFLNFVYSLPAIEKMAKSKAAMLELRWHSQQPVHFVFPLNGAAAAIKEIEKQCSSFPKAREPSI